MNAYQKTIVSLIEEGYNQEFEGEQGDVEEIKDLWDNIYKLCLKILQSSLNLIYSSNQEILSYLGQTLTQSLSNLKKAEESTLLLTYLSQFDNLKKILGQQDESHQAQILDVYDKCRDLIINDVHSKIELSF